MIHVGQQAMYNPNRAEQLRASLRMLGIQLGLASYVARSLLHALSLYIRPWPNLSKYNRGR